MFTSARSTLRKVNKRGAGSLKRNVRCFTPSYSTNNAWSSGRKKPVLDDPVGLLAQPIKWRRPDEAVFLPGAATHDHNSSLTSILTCLKLLPLYVTCRPTFYEETTECY